MVHALEKIQQQLKPGGLLLDIHPTNEPAAIAVRLREQLIPAGWMRESDDYVEYEWADEALQHVVDHQRFVLERVGTFEFVWHADSMNELRAYLSKEWKDASIDDVTAMPSSCSSPTRRPVRGSRTRSEGWIRSPCSECSRHRRLPSAETPPRVNPTENSPPPILADSDDRRISSAGSPSTAT